MQHTSRHHSCFKPVFLAASLLLGSASISASVLPIAQNWTNVSAEAGLSGVSVQLIDLDVSDGITPQITFDNDHLMVSGYGGSGSNDFYEYFSSAANALSPVAASTRDVVHTEGVAAARLTAFDMSVGVGASEGLAVQRATIEPGAIQFALETGLNSPADWQLKSQSYGFKGAPDFGLLGQNDFTWPVQYLIDTNTLEYSPGNQTLAPSFTLTPNTAVVFSGTLFTRARIDLSQLSAYDPQATQAMAISEATVMLFSAAPYDGNTSWGSEEEALAAMQAQSVDVYADVRRFNYDPAQTDWAQQPGVVGPGSSQVEMEDSKSFTFTLTNNTLQSQGGFFSASLGSRSIFAGAMPVPEPSTYAFMLLGLLGVAAVARQSH